MAFPPASYSTGQLVTAANLNANLRDNLITLNGGGLVPTGLIGLWVGGTTVVPTNWGLCDGGSGRQDLRDRVPVAAGGSYAVGATGGAASITPAAHSAHSVSQPAHADHSIGAPPHPTFPPALVLGGDVWASDGNHAGQAITDAHGHTSAAVDAVPHTHGGTLSTLPPYHSRAYMQKTASGLSFTTPRTWTTGDVPTAAQMNADLRDNMNYLAALVMPLGSILIWGFFAGTIPTGWQLCDGTHGTPDLRSKFVIGAGTTYAPGDTGGHETIRLPSHSPSHVVTQADAHGTHSVSTAASHTTANYVQGGGTAEYGVDVTAGGTIGHSGFGVDLHTTHANFGVNGHTSHDDLSMLPPFYALIYMQLISTPVFTTPRTWTTSETVEAAEFNTYLRDNENFINAALAPLGACAWWSGSIGSIPANWTRQPALNDCFVPGAGDGTGGFYVPAQTGGGTSQTPADHPTHNVTQATTHTAHVVTTPADHVSSWQIQAGSTTGHPVLTDNVHSPGNHYTHPWTVNNTHQHAFSVDSGAAHSSHATINTLPPYLALAFIERTS